MKNLTSNLHPPNLALKLFMFLKILFLYFYLEIMVIFQIKPNTWYHLIWTPINCHVTIKFVPSWNTNSYFKCF